MTGTGNLTGYTPDKAKPKGFDPTKNIQLAQVLFDSENKRFIVATGSSLKSKPSDYDIIKKRKKYFPDLEPLPNTDGIYRGEEHKSLLKPDDYDDINVSKSCEDLAIDG